MCALAFCLCFAGVTFAQEVTGTILGTVKDASGAIVPGATVTITDPNKNNQVVRTVQTNDEGEFTAPNLPVSSYEVSVEAANFKKSVQTGVKVDIGQRRSVDFLLEAGNISEIVTIQADQVAVEANTPQVSTTITGNQVRELSINNRNWVQLVTLAPGVSSNLSDQVYVGNFNPDGQANTVAISVNGARSSQNTFTVDGADITDRGSNLTIQTYPSVDSIGEFKVLRALYPAESGRSGGGQVNVVTRSGTDEFHGSFFEFVRNERFNANTYFTNANPNPPFGRDENGKAKRAPFRYNNYGFTVGGPVWFLKFGERDPEDGWFGKMPRTYFFFSEERRNDRRFPTLVGSAPTAGMRNGIFSVPICLRGSISGSTRTCDQILPAGTAITSLTPINPVAQQYLDYIWKNAPLPNAGVFTVRSPASYKADFQQEILKIDTAFTNDWTAYYRYQRDKIPTTEINSIFGNPCNLPDICTGETDSPGRAHTFQTTYVISPNKILEARYTYTYGAILLENTGLISRDRSPIVVPLPYGGDERNPLLNIAGLSTIQAMPNYDNFSDKGDISGSFTWILGNHTTKYGASFSKYRKHENALGGTAHGSLSGFNNTVPGVGTQGTICIDPATNNPIACSGTQATEQNFANFLMGYNMSFTQSKYDLTADFRQRNFEAFAQDEWRVRKGLTFYYGVRYSFFGAPWDRNGFLTNFDPNSWDASEAPLVRGNGSRVFDANKNFCNGIIINTQNYQTGPDAYNCRPTPSPYGKFIYKAPKNNFAPRVGLAWDIFGDGRTVARTGYGMYHEQVLVGSVELHLGANPPYQETITLSGRPLDQPVPAGSSAAVVASDTPPNLIRGWEPNFKTPYMQHWSLDLQHQLDRNTLISVGYYGSKGTNLIGIVDINNLRPGYALTQECATGTSTTPTVDCQAINPDTDLPVPFTSDAGSRILDQLRPYRGWRGIAMIEPWFSSNYHSLQVSATRRLSGDSQVQLAYTWSKNLTNNQTDRSTAPQNSYDIDAEWGRAQLDRRHITTVNYIYELPWYRTQSGFAGKLLGGWQVSGIVNYQTGIPFTATYSAFDPAGIGFLNPNSPAGGRAYILGNPNEGGAQTLEEWFNTGAFMGTPAPTSFAAIPGTSARGAINGPSTFRVDFTLSKNIRFTETMRLQLRGEAFNLFNKTNFTGFGTAASTPSTFGVVNGTRDPRVLQFGIKFYW